MSIDKLSDDPVNLSDLEAARNAFLRCERAYPPICQKFPNGVSNVNKLIEGVVARIVGIYFELVVPCLFIRLLRRVNVKPLTMSLH